MLIILTDRLRQTNQLMAENIGRDQDVANGSVVDELTGLYNQRWTQQRLNRLLHRASVDKKENCLMMLEADHLKEFCDQFGQLGGDQALRDIAYTMLACLRPDDQAGRHLGERFVAFLPNTSLSDACIAAERLRLVVSESMVVLPSGDALPPVSISIGVTSVQSDDTVVKLLARASKALLLARDHGGNCIRFTE